MSTPLKNWKGAAYQALAEYYKVEAERASFEERLEQAQKAAVRAGVSWRYGTPGIESSQDAFACACGAVVPREYGAPVPDHCPDCIEKTRAAVSADAMLEGRNPPLAPPAKPTEGVPF